MSTTTMNTEATDHLSIPSNGTEMSGMSTTMKINERNDWSLLSNAIEMSTMSTTMNLDAINHQSPNLHESN